MPTGFEGVRAAAQDIDARSQAGFSEDKTPWLKLSGDGDKAVVRFLEQGDEIRWAWTHEMPPRGKQKWGDDAPCLNTEDDGARCPACDAGLDRSFNGYINVIWFDGPVFERDGEGNINFKSVVGKADGVFVWNKGIKVFRDLDAKDAKHHGLSTWRYEITRHGTQMNNTSYSVEIHEPEAGPPEWTEKEKELAAKKHDLDQHVTPVSFETMQKWLGDGGGGNGSVQEPAEVGEGINPFVDPD